MTLKLQVEMEAKETQLHQKDDRIQYLDIQLQQKDAQLQRQGTELRDRGLQLNRQRTELRTLKVRNCMASLLYGERNDSAHALIIRRTREGFRQRWRLNW